MGSSHVFEKFNILGGLSLFVLNDSGLEMIPWHDWSLWKGALWNVFLKEISRSVLQTQ